MRAASLPFVRSPALACLAALAALTACGDSVPPEDVALEFWNAAIERDFDEAEPLSTATDEADVEDFLGNFDPKMAPAIGEALTSDDRALVETVFLIHDEREPLKFHTQLVQSDGEWRVDLGSTKEELRRARIDVGVERAAASIAEVKATAGSEASAEAAAEELRRAADEIEAAVDDEPKPADE
jgi:hypothetical protein